MAKPATRPRDRHSYIHFYPENWLGGVAGLPRQVRSVLFDICLYNWDKAAPMPQALLNMQLSDLPEEQAEFIVKMLLDAGKIEEDSNHAVFSPRAMEEAKRANDLWAAKVAGGRKSTLKSAGGSSRSETPLLEDSSRTLPKGDDTSKTPEAMLEDSYEDSSNSLADELEDTSKKELSSNSPRTHLERTKNQEPRIEEKETSDDVSKKKQQDDSIPVRGAVEAMAMLTATQAEADRRRRDLSANMAAIVERWNALAIANGWSQVVKMTEKRQALVTARLADHEPAVILAALDSLPESDYLMGRTTHRASPSFDWLFGEEICTNLIEGFYHREQPEEAPAPPKLPDLIVTHPEECEVSTKVRGWLIEAMGSNTFAHEFRKILFHVEPDLGGERLIVKTESPAINLGDFMIRHRSILNRVAKEFDLLEPWAD